jgi:hypothetical protein
MSQNGNTLFDLRKRFETLVDVIEHFPLKKRSDVFIILFWGTDINNISIGHYEKNKATIQQKYIDNLRFILSKCNELKIRACVGGPGLLRNESKQVMLDDFCGINKDVCKKYKCEYLNIRADLLKADKSGQIVTIDGEHLNEQGAEILGKVFATAIDHWKQTTEFTDSPLKNLTLFKKKKHRN